ncbi:MAG: EAL domain-containing protein [Candidatus Thiodiazotropha sp.]
MKSPINLFNRLKIRSKIWLLITLLVSTMVITLVILHGTLSTTRELATEVASVHLNELIDNAANTRRLAVISADINRLTRTYRTEKESLNQQVNRIIENLTTIATGIKDETVRNQLSTYTASFKRFTAHSFAVNAVFEILEQVISSTQAELHSLENLISNRMIESILSGDDTDYYDQLLSLITGYRESLLIIDKKTTELSTHNFETKIDSDDLLQHLDTLYLRLQTISASTPEVAMHGRRLTAYVTHYQNLIMELLQEISWLTEEWRQLAINESTIHTLIEQTERESSLAADDVRSDIKGMIADTGNQMSYLLAGFMTIIMGAMFYLLRQHIESPLNTLVNKLSAMRLEQLNEPINIGRKDEWRMIEKVLNDMNRKLVSSYTQLEESRASFQALVDNVPGTVYRCLNDSDWTMEYLSDGFFDLTGYDTDAVIANNEISYADIIHPDDRDYVVNTVNEAVSNGLPFSIEYRIVRKDREIRWLFERGQMIQDPVSQTAMKLSGVILDVTEKKQLSDALAESERRYRLLLEHTTEGIFGFDSNGITTFINNSASEMLGYTQEEMIGFNNHKLIHHSLPDGTQLTEEECCMRKPIKDGMEYHVEDEVLWCKNGDSIPIEYWSAPIKSSDGIIGAVVSFHDITERKRSEENMQHLAYHDLLTGLPNRSMFVMELKQVIASYRRYGELFALHLMDLDHFKEVNDRLGHPVGDKLLQQVAKRLAETIRATDILARLGGDEFALIQKNVDDLTDASYLAAKITDLFNDEFVIDDNTIYISTSIGIILADEKNIKLEEILSNADVALYKAKEAGRGLFTFFGDEMSLQMYHEIRLSHDLSLALKRGEFFLQYQPQYYATSGKLAGIEALVRWRHPSHGIMLPTDFIHIAEKRGIIKQISDWVMGEACQQAKAWSDRQIEFGRIAINLCAKQVNDGQFQQSVEALLATSGIAPTLLEFEFTETVLMEATESTQKSLHNLSAHGIDFAIDDFGTGFSSLSYLRKFNAEKIKIDREFIRDVCNNRNDSEIVKAAIALGKALKLTVVAEGVETESQAGFLRQNQCDILQGFLLSHPLSADELEKKVFKLENMDESKEST